MKIPLRDLHSFRVGFIIFGLIGQLFHWN